MPANASLSRADSGAIPDPWTMMAVLIQGYAYQVDVATLRVVEAVVVSMANPPIKPEALATARSGG